MRDVASLKLMDRLLKSDLKVAKSRAMAEQSRSRKEASKNLKNESKLRISAGLTRMAGKRVKKQRLA